VLDDELYTIRYYKRRKYALYTVMFEATNFRLHKAHYTEHFSTAIADSYSSHPHAPKQRTLVTTDYLARHVMQ